MGAGVVEIGKVKKGHRAHAGRHARIGIRLSSASCMVGGPLVRRSRRSPPQPSDPRSLTDTTRPTTAIMPSHSNVSLSSTKTVTPSTFGADKQSQPSPGPSSSRIPVTPAVLRGIFASSRTVFEERSISRAAFFRQVPTALSGENPPRQACSATILVTCFLSLNRFSAFLVSCLAISLFAARGRMLKNSVALLGVANKQ